MSSSASPYSDSRIAIASLIIADVLSMASFVVCSVNEAVSVNEAISGTADTSALPDTVIVPAAKQDSDAANNAVIMIAFLIFRIIFHVLWASMEKGRR